MKKVFTFLVAVLLTSSLFAQSPEMMSYQAVIRNSSSQLMCNQTIGMQISILQGSSSGTAVYVETHTTTTNDNGLVSIEIGNGSVVSGDFSTINWSNGLFFIKTETAIQVPLTTYTITSTSQLLSVPFAFHSNSADTITGTISESDPVYGVSIASGILATDTSNWNNKQEQLTAGTGISIVGNTISASGSGSGSHYIGEIYGGGVVFWVDNTGQHGIIVSMIDVITGQAWSNVTTTLIGTTNDWDGANNTTAIIAQNGHSGSAAQVCNNYTNINYGTGSYSDWYLPSVTEINHIWNNFYEVQKALTNDGNASTTPMATYYWSSTEDDSDNAWYFNLNNGITFDASKHLSYYVRAVRAF